MSKTQNVTAAPAKQPKAAPEQAPAPKSLTARALIQMIKQRLASGEALDVEAETAKIVANHGEPADD